MAEPFVLSLIPVWTLLLAFTVFYYVLFDGFDLGVGILYGAPLDERSRTLLMNSIAPIWDGNETWLILGVLGLLAAFPLAFAIIIPAVYFPIAVMLPGLGVSRRRLRVSLQEQGLAPLLGARLLGRLGGRDLRARGGARQHRPGLRGRRAGFFGHLVRTG